MESLKGELGTETMAALIIMVVITAVLIRVWWEALPL